MSISMSYFYVRFQCPVLALNNLVVTAQVSYTSCSSRIISLQFL